MYIVLLLMFESVIYGHSLSVSPLLEGLYMYIHKYKCVYLVFKFLKLFTVVLEVGQVLKDYMPLIYIFLELNYVIFILLGFACLWNG